MIFISRLIGTVSGSLHFRQTLKIIPLHPLSTANYLFHEWFIKLPRFSDTRATSYKKSHNANYTMALL